MRKDFSSECTRSVIRLQQLKRAEFRLRRLVRRRRRLSLVAEFARLRLVALSSHEFSYQVYPRPHFRVALMPLAYPSAAYGGIPATSGGNFKQNGARLSLVRADESA